MIRFRAALSQPQTNDDETLLQKRLHLLEGDHKAYRETSKWTTAQNAELIRQLRDENRALSRQLAEVQRRNGSLAGTQGLPGLMPGRSRSRDGTGSPMGTAAETEQQPGDADIALLDQTVAQKRRQLDDINNVVAIKQGELARLRDQLRELELQTPLPPTADTAERRQIRNLENRLDKIIIKYNEAQAIRKTYTQIVSRLKEERIGFDRQLQALEEELEAKKHDLEELTLMLHDATHARETTKLDLQALNVQIQEERAQHEQILAQRRAMVKQRTEMQARKERLQQEARQQEQMDEERAKQQQMARIQSMMADRKIENTQEKLTQAEEAFRKIREATGVNSTHEVIEKFRQQERIRANLEEEIQRCTQDIERLQEDKNRVKKEMEEIKNQGPSSFGNKRVVDEFEREMKEEQERCERARATHLRLAKVLVDVKDGVSHLASKIGTISGNDSAAPVTDENLSSVLTDCARRIQAIIADLPEESFLNPDELHSVRTSMTSATRDDTAPGNVRIDLEDRGEDQGDEDSADETDGEDAVLDRNAIKKQANQIMEKKNPSKKKKGSRRVAGARSMGERAEMD